MAPLPVLRLSSYTEGLVRMLLCGDEDVGMETKRAVPGAE
jgi:hypothetical protein